MIDIRRMMIDEFDLETSLTRSVLAIVPDECLDFRATPTARSIRWNVGHLVDIPTWCDAILNQPSLDIAPVGQPPHRVPEPADMAQAIALLETNSAAAREAIESFAVDSLGDPWSLLAGGGPLLTHARHLIYRMYITNHAAHHRGHLLVYLRLCGIEPPHIYGG